MQVKALNLAPHSVNAIKTNRYGKTVDNVNLTKAASKAKQLNKPNGFDKFVAVSWWWFWWWCNRYESRGHWNVWRYRSFRFFTYRFR